MRSQHGGHVCHDGGGVHRGGDEWGWMRLVYAGTVVVQLIGLRFVVAQQTAIASTNPAKMLVWDY